jgi:hypothetical protein
MKNKIENKKKRAGRPSKFKTIDQELLKKLYLDGHTDFEICNYMKISSSMLYRYQLDNPLFREAIKGWKDKAIERVEKRLYERAFGYSHETEQIFCAFGKVTRVKTIKHYPPSEIAAFFLLKNIKPDVYRDKVPEAGDEDLKEAELTFTGIPMKTDKIPENLSRFLN